MGGIGFTIEIAKIADDTMPLPELHKHVWDRLSAQLGHLRKKGNRVTTSEYIWDSAYQGLRDGEGGEWGNSETELSFWFRDMSGCCGMSCEASLHWVRMAFALDGRHPLGLATKGWKIVGPPLVLANELVRGPSYPLIYVRRGMFATVRREPNKELGAGETEAGFGDEQRLEWKELAGKSRDTVEWSALTGQCQCDLCLYYRKLWLPAKERYSPAEHIGAARRAWDLLDGDEQRALEDEALAKVRAWDWTDRAGPPELQVLSDWLVKRDGDFAATTLPIDALGGMVLSRARRR
jgi:hypothetical protein